MATRMTASEEVFPLTTTHDDSLVVRRDSSSGGNNVLLVFPVRAIPITSIAVTVPHDIPAIRMFLHPAGITVAVYPLSREEFGEFWTTPEQLSEWNLVPLPNLWVGAERAFKQLIDYPFEYLQVLMTVLRAQQFLNGSLLTPAMRSRAYKRPSSMMSVDKICSACDTVCTFSIRTLFTAPSRFPNGNVPSSALSAM